MVTLDKIVRLANEGQFDSSGPKIYDLNNINMQKVKTLGEGTKHDICASTASKRQVADVSGRIGDVVKAGVCHAFTPDGRCVGMFKTLFTNACQHECKYCPNATLSHRPKIQKYTPEELAKLTLMLYRGNYVEGLFLSSGIAGNEDQTMEDMIESVRLLREKYSFQGYIHMKILPGASYEHIKQASELVDRVSINIETPSKSYMSELSSTKDYDNDILQRQKYIRHNIGKGRFPAGQTTQFIVGAAQETDKEIFKSMLNEYEEMEVKRSYFSAFNSVKGTELENTPSQPQWRENKLYQVDWLHRIYKFQNKEIEHAFDEDGFLFNKDPKLSIALNIIDSAIDPNEATQEQLLRIPGIGPKSAYGILKLRKRERIWKNEQLARIGVVTKRARYFLKLNGWEYSSLEDWS